VQADLMGHSTHGLQLLPSYVDELETGGMKKTGEPDVINDTGNVLTWNGHYLPGPWLLHNAIGIGLDRLPQHGIVTVVIQRSHHIGCLAVYPERATREGYVMLLTCSDPRTRTVAPYGGVDAVYSPNPIAGGFPTESDPVIFDISMSSTSNGFIARADKENKRLPHPWLLTTDGTITDDPKTFYHTPPSTLLPLGGMDSGYKGFALGLLVEALTSGLAGFGRADKTSAWGASVFLQLINPEVFTGKGVFKKEMQYVKEACLQSNKIPHGQPVRMPGDRARLLEKEQKEKGVLLYPGIVSAMMKYGSRFGVTFPSML
jgi:LDH2 family malate/lactate/ureidoglycolate dehydrogenase